MMAFFCFFFFFYCGVSISLSSVEPWLSLPVPPAHGASRVEVIGGYHEYTDVQSCQDVVHLYHLLWSATVLNIVALFLGIITAAVLGGFKDMVGQGKIYCCKEMIHWKPLGTLISVTRVQMGMKRSSFTLFYFYCLLLLFLIWADVKKMKIQIVLHVFMMYLKCFGVCTLIDSKDD